MDYKSYETLLREGDTFESFYNRNKFLFQEETYYRHKPLTDRHLKYLNLLSVNYNVKSPQGAIVPFIPYSWQIDFHTNSLLLDREDSSNDFVMKGRGISFSYSSMIEAINICLYYKGTIIPVIAHRQQAAIDLVQVAFWLVENANLRIFYNKDKSSELEILFNDGTKSIIRPYPGGSKGAVDAVRSLRPVYAIIDEAGVNTNLAEILDAVEDSMQTTETKIVIGGTPKGTQNKFWQMNQAKLEGYHKYFLPAFNSRPTVQNIAELKPLVWWYDHKKLRNKLMNTPDKFFQEYMCTPFNDLDSLIPVNYIEESFDNNFEEYFEDDEKITKIMAVDVATKNDFAVITTFIFDGLHFKQTFLTYYNGISLPDLESKIRTQINLQQPNIIRIDSTGMGTQMAQSLERDFNHVQSINFSTSIRMNKESINIKQFMCHNFEYFMKRGHIDLIKDDLQFNHISNVDKKLAFFSKQGHNDIFIADCMAILPMNYKVNPEYEDTSKEDKNKNNDALEVLSQFKRRSRAKFKDYGSFGSV